MTVKTVKAKNLPKRSVAKNQRNLYLIAGIIGAVMVVAMAIILMSNNSTVAGNLQKFANIPQSRGSDGAFLLGNPEAPIKFIEFVDYSCSVCLTFKPDVDRFIDQYVATGKAQYEFRALETHGGETTGYAMQLAECAEAQRKGGFWEASEVLFEYGATGTSSYNGNMGFPLADRLSLDKSALLTCVRTATQIDTDMAYANKLKVNSTPTVLVQYHNSQLLPLPGERNFNTLAQLTEAAQAAQ
ncbi:MAG TPA: thioredoxin domain-containing protein [Phototrophicaceae bacterium]|jgi:protein-disulfide isomerase|nr:thioredoxin domain-containing protein [Phototrophicaceae bacterium]